MAMMTWHLNRIVCPCHSKACRLGIFSSSELIVVISEARAASFGSSGSSEGRLGVDLGEELTLLSLNDQAFQFLNKIQKNCAICLLSWLHVRATYLRCEFDTKCIENLLDIGRCQLLSTDVIALMSSSCCYSSLFTG